MSAATVLGYTPLRYRVTHIARVEDEGRAVVRLQPLCGARGLVVGNSAIDPTEPDVCADWKRSIATAMSAHELGVTDCSRCAKRGGQS